jgi:hypothetical protein
MRRLVSIGAACAMLGAAGPAVANTRHHSRPMVECAVTICVTHFRTQITGQQYTSWNIPAQHSGGNCYEVPWIKGSGEQNASFTGSGSVVEAIRIGNGSPSFEMLVPGHLRPQEGIGEGPASISREGSLVTWATGGPCGDNHVPSTEHFSGCGSGHERWTFGFGSDSANRVSLGGDAVVPSLSTNFDNCPLEWTGSEAISGNETGLFGGFTVPLPNRELFSNAQNKIIVHGRFFAADPPPTGGPYRGLTGETLVTWTVTLTRIAHKQFPIVAQ